MSKILITNEFNFVKNVLIPAKIRPLSLDEMKSLMDMNEIYDFFPITPVRKAVEHTLNFSLTEYRNFDKFNILLDNDIEGIPIFKGERFEKIVQISYFHNTDGYLIPNFMFIDFE